jgi:hypothetical protein
MNQDEVLQLLAKALLGQSEKAVTSTPSTVFGHGDGGLFSTPGLDKSLFSALTLPMNTLESRLPAFPSNDEYPMFGIMTGVTASSGSNPEAPCDDPPTAGMMKMCTKSAPFGLFSRATRALDAKDFGRRTNRGEMLDLNLIGNPFAAQDSFAQSLAGFGNAARNDIAKAFYELGVAWSRDFATRIYAGNPANNTASDGYMEFWGLDALINTGYADAVTGTACPAADSIVHDWGSVDIADDAAGFVRTLTYMYRNLQFNARRMGLAPANIVLAMSWGLFYALTEIYPITYSTYRSTGLIPDNARLVVDSRAEREERDAMLNGEYLLIDGVRVPVIVDNSIVETDDGGAFTSSLYMIPMTVLGNIPSTYIEYFNWAVPGGALDATEALGIAGAFDVRDGGRFLIARDSHTWTCVQMAAWTKPRLVMRTPYLAGRIENVKYEPELKERDWNPTNPSYYKDGGRTSSPTINPSFLAIP